MGRIKPIVAISALMGAILGEGWLRSKAHRFDEDYVGVLHLVGGAAARISGRGHAARLRSGAQIFPPIL